MLRLSHQCRFSYFEIPDFAVVYMTGVQVIQFTLSAHSFHTYTSTVQNRVISHVCAVTNPLNIRMLRTAHIEVNW